jgi:hypothetical protein
MARQVDEFRGDPFDQEAQDEIQLKAPQLADLPGSPVKDDVRHAGPRRIGLRTARCDADCVMDLGNRL